MRQFSLLKKRWMWAAALGVTVSLGAAACANRTGDETPAPEQTQAEEQHHRHRGPALVVIDTTLETVSLTPEQVTSLDTLRARLDVDSESRKELKKELKGAAIDMVRAGRANDADMNEIVDRAMEAIETRITLSEEAMAEVHGMLDAEQRTAVADALREVVAEKFAKVEKRRMKRKRFNKLATHLMLTGAQVDKIEQVKKELVSERKRLKPTRDQIEAMIDAFEGDDFVPKMKAFHEEKLTQMRDRMMDMQGHADTVLSILDADQRDVLAELIEIGPKEAGLHDAEQAPAEAPIQ